MTKIRFIGDSILSYIPRGKFDNADRRLAIENYPTEFIHDLYPSFKNIQVDINVFCLGINDYLRPHYDEDYRAKSTSNIIQSIINFIGEINCDNNGKLIVLSLLPLRGVYDWNSYFAYVNHEIPIVNNALHQYCMQNGISFIDTYSYFADKKGQMRKDLSDDGIHPSQSKGYELFTNLLNVEIEKIQQHSEKTK